MPTIFTEPDAPPAETPRKRPAALTALGWALAGALCASLAWAVAWLAVFAFFELDAPFAWLTLDNFPAPVAIGAGYGGAAGMLVGLIRRSKESAVILGFGGAVFGALAGMAVTLALVTTQGDLHPLLASSLAMAAVGFVAGLSGRLFAPRPERSDEAPFDEDDDAPAVTIEWLLRDGKRPWRIGRPLARVLPVLVVALGALVGAGFASSAALLAVGLLGFAAAHAIHRQEKRLDALERRSGSVRDTRPPV